MAPVRRVHSHQGFAWLPEDDYVSYFATPMMWHDSSRRPPRAHQRDAFGRKTATTLGFSPRATIGPMAADIADLGPMLRTWRGRVSPAAAGLPVGHGRRVTGLRREDLAELARISVDYVVRLEQGRYVTPSAQVLAALARALQLTDAERDHLYRLAGLTPPVGRGDLRPYPAWHAPHAEPVVDAVALA